MTTPDTYRIDYSIIRCVEGSDDETEIGFGSSAEWHHVDAALYAIGSDIQNRMWETTAGMPDPEEAS